MLVKDILSQAAFLLGKEELSRYLQGQAEETLTEEQENSSETSVALGKGRVNTGIRQKWKWMLKPNASTSEPLPPTTYVMTSKESSFIPSRYPVKEPL